MNVSRISIVVPSYNQAPYLEQCLRSVLEEGYPELELFVMDGGSDDGSVDIIRKYQRSIVYWCSERDGGQADAIRKGLARASGEIFNWLNSDDMLAPGALARVADLADRNPEAEIFAAATATFSQSPTLPTSVSMPSGLDVETLMLRTERPIRRHQPGIFFRRRAYERVHGLDRELHFCMDLDLHLRMLIAGSKVVYDKATVAYFRSHQGSKTQGERVRVWETVQEYMRVADRAGSLCGMRPNHRPHGKVLCGGAALALGRGQWKEAGRCLRLAVDVVGVREVAREGIAGLRRKWLRNSSAGGGDA